jgi:hypothetical protein
MLCEFTVNFLLHACNFRVRILDELEPGAIFSLWRASIGRYVLDEERSQQLFNEFYIWDDFPSQPGEVRQMFRLELSLLQLGCMRIL